MNAWENILREKYILTFSAKSSVILHSKKLQLTFSVFRKLLVLMVYTGTNLPDYSYFFPAVLDFPKLFTGLNEKMYYNKFIRNWFLLLLLLSSKSWVLYRTPRCPGPTWSSSTRCCTTGSAAPTRTPYTTWVGTLSLANPLYHVSLRVLTWRFRCASCLSEIFLRYGHLSKIC